MHKKLKRTNRQVQEERTQRHGELVVAFQLQDDWHNGLPRALLAFLRLRVCYCLQPEDFTQRRLAINLH